MESNTKVGGSTVDELVKIVFEKWRVPSENLDEVYPGIFIGDEIAAKNIDLLKKMKMTHILNAACCESASFIYVNTSQGYYDVRNFECNFLGLSAIDSPTYKLTRHFQQASDFIESAVNHPNGRILVHCRQGVSRSATLVLVYLMLKKGMTGREAVTLVRKKRNIFPNKGFLKEICILEETLFKPKQIEDNVSKIGGDDDKNNNNETEVSISVAAEAVENTEIKEKENHEVKENGNVEVKDNDPSPSQIKENGSNEIKENGSSEIKENGSSEIKETGSNEIKENGSSEIKDNGVNEITFNENVPIECA